MQQLDLATLVRTTILAGMDARYGAGVVAVRAAYQPQQIGAPVGPAVLVQPIMDRRVGHLRREYRPAADGAAPMIGTMTQWWETTLQIGAVAQRLPDDGLPTALDICRAASDILQGDAGLAALAAQRVRPLRVTEVRTVQWVNESDQYEQMPNFDLVLSHPEILTTEVAPAEAVEPIVGGV